MTEHGHAKGETIADDVPQRPPAARTDRGFRVVADALDDAARTDVREILFNQVTELPSLQFLLTQIRTTLEARRQVGLLTLIVNPSVRLEELFGWVTEIKAEALRQDDVVAELSMSGNSFVFLLSPPRYQPFILHDDLTRLRQRIAQHLGERLTRSFPPAVVAKFTSSVGCCVLTHEPNVPVQRLVLRALDQAYADAFRERDAELAARVARLDELIARRELVTLYQPIVDLRDQGVLGYEALSRGPPGELQDPALMFKLAYEADAVWKLDRACRELALAGARRLPEGALLFLNTDPDSVFDPELQRSTALRELAGRVVLEITERAAIRDFGLFRRAIEVIRGLGLRLAIDDVGSAYSGLRLLVETRPDFIKLDMAITGSLPDSQVQRDVVRTVARMAEGLHAPLIVEAIERQEQLDVLATLDIPYAQGYLFGEPDAQFRAPSVPPRDPPAHGS